MNSINLKNKEYMLSRVNNLLLHPDRIKNKKLNLTDANKAKIEKLKNSYNDKRCFIIGGAPSLKELDLSLLNDEYTFTVNKGYKLRDIGLIKSNSHIILDRQLLEDDGVFDEIPADFADNFFINAEITFNKESANKIFVENLGSNMIRFQEDLTKPLMHIGTVIGQAIQIAYYMGFSKIYLIGVDLDFSIKPGHVYEESKEESFRQETISVKGERVMLNGMQTITSFLEGKGVSIYNASPAGDVNCMPRVNYKEIFNK